MNLSKTLFLKRISLIFLIYLCLIVISYFFFDIPIALYFRNLDWRSTLLSYSALAISPEASLVGLPVLFYFFQIVWKIEKVGNKILLVILAVACSNAATSCFKVFFGRARPKLLFTSDTYGFSFFEFGRQFQSFPSGHAATIGAITGALSCFLPKYSYFFNLTAILFALIRVVQTEHFFSDVLAGVLLGTCVAQFLYLQMTQSKYRF